MATQKLTFKLKNKLADLEKIHAALERLRRQLGFSNKCKCETNLVLEELFTNIISYGYGDGGDHEVVLRIGIDAQEMHIEIEDDGVPFDPLTAESPCLATDLDKRDVGGLGVFFARKFADQIHYERVGGKNIVKITKRFQNDHRSDKCPPAATMS
ncbi:MAG: ATP-binding protein [Desulfosarcinaceae bacterium]|jgi:anti-sigma regulatory factor (Ser/Thr protein kinase)